MLKVIFSSVLLLASRAHLSAPHLALSSGQQFLKKTDERRDEAVRHLSRVISGASLHFRKFKVEQRI